MEGSVINAKQDIGISLIAKLAIATDMREPATQKPVNATSAKISQLATTAIDVLKDTMEIHCLEVILAVDLAVVQIRLLRVTHTLHSVL